MTAHNDHTGDCIHIEALELFARVGVPDDERAMPQRLLFNITLWPMGDASDLNDEISRAVDYAAVCAVMKEFVQGRADRLIETLADSVAAHLLEVFPIRKVTIELRKFILPEVKFVSAVVTRTRK